MAWVFGTVVIGPYSDLIYNYVAVKKLYQMRGFDAPPIEKGSTSLTAIKYSCDRICSLICCKDPLVKF